jgi:hypothetical protein
MFRRGILVAERGGGGEGAMFLKRLERRKDGKRHAYWALVPMISFTLPAPVVSIR